MTLCIGDCQEAQTAELIERRKLDTIDPRDAVIAELRTKLSDLEAIHYATQRQAIIDWFDENKDRVVKDMGNMNGIMEKQVNIAREALESYAVSDDGARAREALALMSVQDASQAPPKGFQ